MKKKKPRGGSESKRTRERMRERGGRIERVRVRVYLGFFLFIVKRVGAGRGGYPCKKNLYTHNPPRPRKNTKIQPATRKNH
jgi:hypothetical protein